MSENLLGSIKLDLSKRLGLGLTVLLHFMDINKILKKNEWVLAGSTFSLKYTILKTACGRITTFYFKHHKFKLEWTSSDHQVQPVLITNNVSAKIYFRQFNQLPSDQHVSEMI